MSAPRTDLEKQKRRHWAQLLGMAAVTVFALAVIAYWLFEEAEGTAHPLNDTPQAEVPPGGGAPGRATPPGAPTPAPPAHP